MKSLALADNGISRTRCREGLQVSGRRPGNLKVMEKPTGAPEAERSTGRPREMGTRDLMWFCFAVLTLAGACVWLLFGYLFLGGCHENCYGEGGWANRINPWQSYVQFLLAIAGLVGASLMVRYVVRANYGLLYRATVIVYGLLGFWGLLIATG